MKTKIILQVALLTGSMFQAMQAQPVPPPVIPPMEDVENQISRARGDMGRAGEKMKRMRSFTTPMPGVEAITALEDMQMSLKAMEQASPDIFNEDMRRAVEEMKRVPSFAAPMRGVEALTSLEDVQANLQMSLEATPPPAILEEDVRRAIENAQRAMEMNLMAMQQAPPAPPAAPSPTPAPAPMAVAIGKSVRGNDEDRMYRNGKQALESREWERAAEYFGRVVELKGTRADAGMYWKAYAQNKLGRRNEAAATLAEMIRLYPTSRWLDDAKALEVEVKQSSGQPISPDSEADEDLKILALNGMIHTDPERALPVLEKLLQKGSSPRLKERALFVLAQSKAPQSREILLKMARGGTNPDLQYKAVEYVGYQSTAETRQALSDLYAGSNDVQLKRAVLRGFTASRDKDRLLNAAKGEQSPELRREAIRGLGSVDANAELWQLYQSEPGKEMKIEILRALPGRRDNIDKLVEVAKAEKDPAVKAELVRQIGYSRAGDKGSEALVALYAPDNNPQVRRAIVDSLRGMNNAKALVEIARVETDLKMKQMLVETLSHMKSKEASDYLLELLNK